MFDSWVLWFGGCFVVVGWFWVGVYNGGKWVGDGDYGFARLGLLWFGLVGGDYGFAGGLFLFVILVVGGWVVVAMAVAMGGGG